MKKRIVSIILSVLIIVCVVPFAAAEDAVEEEVLFFVEDNLMRMSYGDIENLSEIAVGDSIEVIYTSSVPAKFIVNGEKVGEIPAGDREFFSYPVTETGSIEVSIERGGEVIVSHSFTVITSKEMYSKNLREAFNMKNYLVNPFPPIEELQDAAMQGFPVGNPFLPAAYIVMIITNMTLALFSFTRIVR